MMLIDNVFKNFQYCVYNQGNFVIYENMEVDNSNK